MKSTTVPVWVPLVPQRANPRASSLWPLSGNHRRPLLAPQLHALTAASTFSEPARLPGATDGNPWFAIGTICFFQSKEITKNMQGRCVSKNNTQSGNHPGFENQVTVWENRDFTSSILNCSKYHFKTNHHRNRHHPTFLERN